MSDTDAPNDTPSRRHRRDTYTLAMFGDGTRGRLLQGTAEAASRHGVRGCTVQHILDAADLSRRTFYKHFRSAEDAFDALFEVSTQVLIGSIQMAVTACDGPVERLVAGLDAYLELQKVGGRLIMELQAESIRPESPLNLRREQLMDVLCDLFGAEFDRIAGHPVDRLLVRALLFDIEGMVIYQQRRGKLTDAVIARLRRVHLAILTRTLGVEGADPLPHPLEDGAGA